MHIQIEMPLINNLKLDLKYRLEVEISCSSYSDPDFSLENEPNSVLSFILNVFRI